MPLTDKIDAELAALVAERVLNMSEHIIDEEDPENYPVFQMWGDGNPGPGVGVVIYRERAAWYDNLPECFDPANDLNDIWSACREAMRRKLITEFQISSGKVVVCTAPQFGRRSIFRADLTENGDHDARTICAVLLRACGVEEE